MTDEWGELVGDDIPYHLRLDAPTTTAATERRGAHPRSTPKTGCRNLTTTRVAAGSSAAMSAGSSKLDGSAGCSNTQADPNPSSITPREADMKSSEAIFPEIAVETEIAAMAVLVDAFGTLDAAARHRVLKWANERWGVVPVNTWPIASDVTVETKHWRGRMVVEDVEQFTTPSGVLTTTYTLRSLDGPPPLLFGMLRPDNSEQG